MATVIKRLGVIGLGLIGGSVARAAKQSGFSAQIAGYDGVAAVSAEAVELGVIDVAYDSVAALATDCELIVIAVPTLAVEDVFAALAQVKGLFDSRVVTDVASVKGQVFEAAKRQFSNCPDNLILGHPIAGSEQSGVAAANAELFRDYRVILTPQNSQFDGKAHCLVSQLWAQACGAEVVNMSVEQHDEVLAATSHLPHMLAFSLVDTLVSLETKHEIFRFAAGGFRDFSRIASSHPQMWHDIALSNRDALLAVMDDFEHHLAALRQEIESADSDGILNRFQRAKKARDEFTELLPAKRSS